MCKSERCHKSIQHSFINETGSAASRKKCREYICRFVWNTKCCLCVNGLFKCQKTISKYSIQFDWNVKWMVARDVRHSNMLSLMVQYKCRSVLLKRPKTSWIIPSLTLSACVNRKLQSWSILEKWKRVENQKRTTENKQKEKKNNTTLPSSVRHRQV